MLLAVLPAATSQEAGDLPVSEEPATNDAVEKTEEAVEAPPPKAPAAPSKAPAPPAKAAPKATPPPAPPAPPVTPPVTPPVNPAVAAARRLEEDAQQQKDTLNRDFLDACRKSDTTKIEDLLRQGAAEVCNSRCWHIRFQTGSMTFGMHHCIIEATDEGPCLFLIAGANIDDVPRQEKRSRRECIAASSTEASGSDSYKN